MDRPADVGPPTPSRPTVLRPRLLQALQQRFASRVLAVVAGAGFGKSTLLAQAVAENRLAGAGRDVWVGCSADHRAASVLAEDLLGGLGAPLPVDPPTDPGSAARLVCDAVWALAPQEVALVLDDAQHLAAGSAGQRMVSALAETLPGNGHLVLASRPPLTVGVSRALARGDGVLLQEADLAFTAEELSAFAADRGVDPVLLEGISGWPALAELIATTGRRRVADFLWEEVLATLPERGRQVLAVLAAVGAADSTLVGELLGRPVDLDEVLDGVPLVSAGGGRWSVHPLWQSALRAGAQDPVVGRAVAAAPAALHRRGLLRQAMALLLHSGDWPEAGRLLVRICSGISPEVAVDVLADWQRRLPAEVLATPAGRLLTGTLLRGTDRVGAQEELRAAGAAFRAAGDVGGEIACLVGVYRIAFWANDLAALLPVVQRWEELERDGATAAAQVASLGRALLTTRPAVARAEVAELDARAPGPLGVLVDWARAHLLATTVGEPERAIAWAREVLPRAPGTLHSAIRCELVEALRLSGRAEEAQAEAVALRRDAERADVLSPRHFAVLVVAAAFLGEDDRARTDLGRLRVVAETAPMPWAGPAALIGEAAAAAGNDDERAARALRDLQGHRMALPLVLMRITPAALVLQYVLDPASRPGWDDVELLGALAGLRRLARAVVALREQPPPAVAAALGDLAEEDLDIAVGGLPTAWVVHLAAALTAGHRDEGRRMVQRLGPAARPGLHALDAAGGPFAGEARRLLGAVPSTPQHRLRLEVLGGLRLVRDDVEVEDAHLRRQRVRQLLGHLVVHRGAARHELTAALWPDLAEPDAARNLRVTLNYVQRVLEPQRDERDAPFFLRARGTRLELAEDEALEVDLWAFEADLAEAERAEARAVPSVALQAYLRAVRRYGGDLLADADADGWLARERDRLRRRYQRAVLRAGHLLLAAGGAAQAEDLALTALAVDDTSEEAHRILVAALLGQGERAAARRALDRLFDRLTELDLTASPAVVRLVDEVRAPSG